MVFIGIGVIFLVVGYKYRLGTASSMGPGYLPRLVSILLILVGLATAARGLLGAERTMDRLAMKPLVSIILAMLSFALLVRGAGLIPAVIATVWLGAMGSTRLTPGPTLLLSVLLAVFSWAVFSWGLGLPLPAFGSWLRIWQLSSGG